MDEQFNLENEYQAYLDRVKIKESDMHPTQRVETKRAFFAACAQMLVLFRDKIGAIEKEEDAIKAMEDLFNQAHEFWLKQSNQLN